MNIKKIVVGILQENCYIIEKNNKCLVVDPGDEYNKIKNSIIYDVVGILLTHDHFDHIGALNNFINDYNVKINDKFDGFNYEIIKTPGHTSTSLTFYFKEENIMFTGDFLFKDSIGRTDLGGNNKDMINSLKLIKEYNKDTLIYPGHGDITTLGNEIDTINYYISIL